MSDVDSAALTPGLSCRLLAPGKKPRMPSQERTSNRFFRLFLPYKRIKDPLRYSNPRR